MQVQAMGSRDLAQIEGLNLNGEKRKIYFYGEVDAIVRSANKGGDLVVIDSGVNAGTWLVVQSLSNSRIGARAAVVPCRTDRRCRARSLGSRTSSARAGRRRAGGRARGGHRGRDHPAGYPDRAAGRRETETEATMKTVNSIGAAFSLQ
jgi:hypothetical protein